MKKIILSLVAAATLSLSSFGQAPEGFNYQAVVRDAGNTIVNNQAVGMRMTIQQGSIGGTAVYSETFATTSNAYGLVNLQIGSGTSSDDFSAIDWSAGPFFMETAIDLTGGTNYSVMGTSQLMSVPYALYAKTSGNGQGPAGPQGIQGPAGVVSDGSAAGNTLYWDGTSWVTNSSNVFNNGGNIGIGTIVPTEKLEVEGNMKLNGTLNDMRVGNIGSGLYNVVFGNNASNYASNGDDNTIIGNSAMVNSVTGNNSVAVGAYALGANISGHTNGAVGWGALANNTVGIQNNALGWLALQSNTTGSQNTAIGNYADVAFGNLTNATAIGSSALVDASNKIQLGNTDVTLVNTSGYYQGVGFKTPTGTSTQYLMADGSVSAGAGVTTAGSGINVTGAGTAASPYVVSTTSPCGLAIGQTYQGGIIFYLDASGCHGLISAPTNQSTGIQWYNGSHTNTTAFASCVGCGDGNTSMIVFNQGAGSYAAKLCYDLSIGVYSDWYLPSKYELNLMFLNIGQGNALGLGNVGGFTGDYYWCSTEAFQLNSWSQDFGNGLQQTNNKYDTYYVRAIRAF